MEIRDGDYQPQLTSCCHQIASFNFFGGVFWIVLKPPFNSIMQFSSDAKEGLTL